METPPVEDSIEFHYPGQNFTGPGTHIYQRVMDKVLPNNRTDAVTLMHDVDYMLATNSAMADKADADAIKNSDWSRAGLATKLGLTIRRNFFKNSFYGGSTSVGYYLKYHIKDEPVYVQRFAELGLSKVLENW